MFHHSFIVQHIYRADRESFSISHLSAQIILGSKERHFGDWLHGHLLSESERRETMSISRMTGKRRREARRKGQRKSTREDVSHQGDRACGPK